MDSIQEAMRDYRDTEAITFFLCLAPHQVILGAKADVGDRVHLSTVSWTPEAGDRVPEILAEMRELAAEIRAERQMSAPATPDVQLG